MGYWPENLSVHTAIGNDMAANLPEAGMLAVTRAVLGKGQVDARRDTLAALTEVCGPVMECPVMAKYLGDGVAEILVIIDNEQITAAFDCWQIGIYALRPDGGEVLFFIQQATEKDHIPLVSQTPLKLKHYINIRHSNMLNISVKPPGYMAVPQEEFIPVKEKVEGLSTVASTGKYEDLLNKPDIPPAYTHPATHAPSIIKQDANNRFVTDAEKSKWHEAASLSVSFHRLHIDRRGDLYVRLEDGVPNRYRYDPQTGNIYYCV